MTVEIKDFDVDPRVCDIVTQQGISTLYPPQADALPHVLAGENVVLSVPTAGGKSLVAYLGMVQRLLTEGGKALYVVPLKALAREKYEELSVFKQLGLKIALSTGDLDESDPRLSRYDIIVCTSEKADSILRHGVKWIEKVRVLVVDEIHLIHDPSRGPTLEVIIARFKGLNPDTQIIALSATIKNAMDLSVWLDGKLVSSEWRPVPLREGVFHKREILFEDGTVTPVSGKQVKPVERLVEDSVGAGGQVLVFVNTRRSTVSVAHRLAGVVSSLLTSEDVKKLTQHVGSKKRQFAEVTSVDDELHMLVRQGVAFHNAGLSSRQRRMVEQGFKQRLIKCIVATPTLAAGVNIPAQRVVIRDLWRYEANFGMQPIPILEYKQQAGRAGRPQYDTVGEAITIAKNGNQKDKIYENYIHADTEPIYSKLGSQAALRMHLLAVIASRFVDSLDQIYAFIESTFFAYQAEVYTLEEEIETALTFLRDHEFIEDIDNGRLMATLFGTRTSSLYIDPLSAVVLRSSLEKSCARDTSTLSFVHAVCATPDIRSLYLRSSDSWVEEYCEHRKGSFLVDLPPVASNEYEWFLSDVKTAKLIEDWINEISEDQLIAKYHVGPGDIHSLVDTAEWLVHAAREFARMYNFDCVSDLDELKLRVHHGCKKELLNLIQLKGIGRVRARALFSEGFKTISDLRGVPLKRLAQVSMIGEGIAKNIKRQIGEQDGKQETELSEYR